MELSVKNFRCWNRKTICLAPKGITLLIGHSGAGKSSLLEAIAFLITGKGKNIISQGKSTCEVTLVLNDGTFIKRSKRPNILHVKIPGGVTYEDAAAQGYINEKFTTNFMELGYLGQSGKNNSFVLKGPSDKLAFIESLAFLHVDITQIKSSAHNIFKERSEFLRDTTSKLEILEEQLETCKDIEKVKFPIKTSVLRP